jgi:argininosuccinate synthase
MSKVVLAYSGGPASSAALSWLVEQGRGEVVALTLDLGHGDALEAVRDRALSGGAARAHVIDARDEFAYDFVLPALQAGAFAHPRVPLAAALARAILARHLIEMARIEGVTTVAHACAGRDRTRLDRLLADLDPSMAVLVRPSRRRTSIGRVTRADASDLVSIVDLEFESGVPVSINDVAMPFPELLQSLATIAGTPALDALQLAHRALVGLVAPRDAQRLADRSARGYAKVADEGRWFSPAREAFGAFAMGLQPHISGRVALEFHLGRGRVVEGPTPRARVTSPSPAPADAALR